MKFNCKLATPTLALLSLVFGLTFSPTMGQATVITGTTTSTTATISNNGCSLSSNTTETAYSARNIKFAETLSTSYSISVTAQDILKLRMEYNLGYREIGMVYTTVSSTGKSVANVVELRQQKLGWGEIAKLYGVKVSDLKQRNYVILEKAQIVADDQSKDCDDDKLEKTGKHPDKPERHHGNPEKNHGHK